jgi:hypothetical protein
MSMWSKLVAYLSGWPESKEERIQTYAEERRDQKQEEINKRKKTRKQGNIT